MEPKSPQDTESRHADKYIVRFPDGMRDRLKEQAKTNNRTLNAEIVARLQNSFESDREIEQMAFESTIHAHGLEQEIQRLTKLLEHVQAFGVGPATGATDPSSNIDADALADRVVEKLTTRADLALAHEAGHKQIPVVDVLGPILENIMANREKEWRARWEKEWGFDPGGPPVKLPDSKGPAKRRR